MHAFKSGSLSCNLSEFDSRIIPVPGRLFELALPSEAGPAEDGPEDCKDELVILEWALLLDELILIIVVGLSENAKVDRNAKADRDD